MKRNHVDAKSAEAAKKEDVTFHEQEAERQQMKRLAAQLRGMLKDGEKDRQRRAEMEASQRRGWVKGKGRYTPKKEG